MEKEVKLDERRCETCESCERDYETKKMCCVNPRSEHTAEYVDWWDVCDEWWGK